jgi:hypothetical protein
MRAIQPYYLRPDGKVEHDNGQARQVLIRNRSTFADPKPHFLIRKDVALRPDGSVAAIQVAGIALSLIHGGSISATDGPQLLASETASEFSQFES